MSYDFYSYFRVIQSKSNELVKQLAIHQEGGLKSSKLRKETNLALIEGIHLLDSWLSQNKQASIHTITVNNKSLENLEIQNLLKQLINFFQGSDANFPDMVLIDDGLKKSITNSITQMGEGALLQCLVKIPKVINFQYDQDLVILDAIQDSGNVGTILRTCAAAGFNQVICTKGTAAIWSNKVLRAGMGAQASLKILEGIDPRQILTDLEVPLLSSQLNNAQNLYLESEKLIHPVAWVFGNEGQGVNPLLSQDAMGIMIPQASNVESLNVSAAAAIALFETRRVRHFLK